MENTSPPPKLDSQNYFSNSVTASFAHAQDGRKAIEPEHYISIISNSHLLREALILLLKAHQSIPAFTYSISSADTVSNVSASQKQLVLLDSGVGRELTINRIRQLRSLSPSPLIVALELKYDTDLILDCIEAGTHAYALQGASSTDIAQVIEQVYQGAFRCPPEITAKLFERLTQAKNTPQSPEKLPLTRRELEVLHYVAREYSDREIAAQLVVEVRTVKHHVHNILQKLKVRNRWEAAQLALKNRWLDHISC